MDCPNPLLAQMWGILKPNRGIRAMKPGQEVTLDKDFDLKRDPRYQTSHLRERVNDAIKRIRDDADELKEPYGKTLSKRGYQKRSKDNKSDR
jgi:hypothetical protein